ncbi:MAG: homocysteine biosynthesis protein [Elusimicrobiota bacterium]
MSKTIEQINEKIKKGDVVVVTAEEMIDIVKKEGVRAAAQKVDVVTTGTFGPMCSSGMYMNVGHTSPRIKIGGGECYLNDVPAYCGWAAVDLYLGCTALPGDDPGNKVYPGEFRYGGGHVIQEFVEGKDVRLEATTYGTDCYPKKKLKTLINIKDVNECVLFNPRNCYQNYNVAVNLGSKAIYTYMGVLKPDMGNANYSSAGQLSPLMNDPLYRTIGIGTRIFLGGGTGYIAWWGTQHNPTVRRNENGVPLAPAGTLALIGDLKQMNGRFLVGTSMLGYGTTLTVGVGIPIPILDEGMAAATAVRDEEIFAPIVDYSESYPQVKPRDLGRANYAQLRSGKITVQGRPCPTAPLSSYSKAAEIATLLKDWIKQGKFYLTQPVEKIPGAESGVKFKLLKERPYENNC